MKRTILTASLIAAAAPALAHPGHEVEGPAIAHWVSDPAHAVVLGLTGLLIAVGLIAAALSRRSGRRHD